jgi:hypothetical protein
VAETLDLACLRENERKCQMQSVGSNAACVVSNEQLMPHMRKLTALSVAASRIQMPSVPCRRESNKIASCSLSLVGAEKIKKLHFLLVPSHVPTSNRKFIGSKLKGQLIIAATVLWLLYGWFSCNAVWPFQISVGLQ